MIPFPLPGCTYKCSFGCDIPLMLLTNLHSFASLQETPFMQHHRWNSLTSAFLQVSREQFKPQADMQLMLAESSPNAQLDQG